MKTIYIWSRRDIKSNKDRGEETRRWNKSVKNMKKLNARHPVRCTNYERGNTKKESMNDMSWLLKRII